MNIEAKLENESQIKELIRLGVASYFDKFNTGISKTKLLKILYLTSDELSDNNPIKNSIPFYWYIHGPYSPPALKLIDELEQDKILTKQNFKNASIYTAVSKTRIVPHDDSLQEFHEKLNVVLSKVPKSLEKILEMIYADKAPHKFYSSFKDLFQSQLNNYFKVKNTEYTSEDFRFLLNSSFGDLPIHSSFSKFKQAYSDFTNIVSDILEIKDLPESSQILVKNIALQVFETFADGIRILEHDSFYTSFKNEWNEKFINSVNEMEKSIDKLFKEYEKITQSDSNLKKLSDITPIVLDLRSKNKLDKISFYPQKNIPEAHDGGIDAEIFYDLNDTEFTILLNKFKDSHNAYLHYTENNELKLKNYRLITT